MKKEKQIKKFFFFNDRKWNKNNEMFLKKQK